MTLIKRKIKKNKSYEEMSGLTAHSLLIPSVPGLTVDDYRIELDEEESENVRY